MPGRYADAALPCGVVQVDHQRVIISANEEAAKLLERPVSGLLQEHLSVVLPIASRVFLQTHVLPKLALDGVAEELYFSLQTTSGNEVPVLMSIRRVADGDDLRDILAFLPMRRRHVYGRELLRSQEAAARASEAEQEAQERVRQYRTRTAMQDRLASLGTLAAGIAHEINNPLTFVLGNLDVLNERLQEQGLDQTDHSQADVTTLMAETRDGADRIRRIVQSLRGLSRHDESRIGPVNLGVVVQTGLRLCTHELSGRSSVLVEVADPPPVVRADEGRLVQVVANLVINATQAMPTRPPAENRIVVRCREGQPRMARLEVEDNGCGIPLESQKSIFEPFYTTKAAGVGTGLGLSVCHSIITDLGGHIQVASVQGEGSSFEITLPLYEGSREQHSDVTTGHVATTNAKTTSAPGRPPASGIPPRRYRALVVDDEAGVIAVVQRVLRGEYDLTIATSAEELLVRVDAGETFDFILCDMMLKGASGMDIHERLVELAPALARRMIFMSGGTFTERAQAFLARVPNPHIEKPFRLPRLRSVCREMCALQDDDAEPPLEQ